MNRIKLIKSKRNIIRLLWIIFAAMALLCGCTGTKASGDQIGNGAAVAGGGAGKSGGNASEMLKVHFIDVGQGDAALIESNGHFMLIDAGEREQGPVVVSYLKEQGVEALDYVIGTHPHSDHIGGLSDVLRAFPAEMVLIPKKEHTTKAYERLLDAIQAQSLKVTLPVPGDTYKLGSAGFQIIAPVRDYEDDLNNWSIGLRLAYGENHFVFCGDAEKKAERDMVENGLELSADVLKLSHHGSYSSSSKGFVDAVDPGYAVISCGRDNDYGYPHREIKKLLEDRGIETYRTDRQGTITAVSDGSHITWTYTGADNGQSQPDSRQGQPEPEYVLNVNTKKFHLPSCQSARDIKAHNKEEYRGTRQELMDMGYEPCQNCQP